MQIGAKYSHLNGEEYLLVHKPALWQEVQDVIAGVDAAACKTGLESIDWAERRNTFWVTDDEKLLRGIYGLSSEEQKLAIQNAGHEPIMPCNQTDFVKDRVAVEVQFGKYALVAHDLSVKHLSFYVADIIDAGIEILPMKELEKEMSSGVPYYERDLLNVLRQGRGVPAVPLVLIGVFS